MKLTLNAAILLGIVLFISFFYFVYAYFNLPQPQETHGFWTEIGGGMGGLAGWVLVFLYGRGLLKLLLNDGPLLQRLLPENYAERTQSSGQQFLKFLNRTHPYLGVLTVVLIAGHAGLVSSSQVNPFLILTMAVVFWQGGFGLFLKLKLMPLSLRKQSFGIHAQLVTGGLILIFAGFGHLLIGD